MEILLPKIQIPHLSPALVCTGAHPRGDCVSSKSMQTTEVFLNHVEGAPIFAGDGDTCPDAEWSLRALQRLPLSL